MELVSTAAMRSLGERIALQQATPAALHPSPRAMERQCPPQELHFSNTGSMTQAALGRKPRSSSRVKQKKKTVSGGNITATAQDMALNPPWIRLPVTHGAVPR